MTYDKNAENSSTSDRSEQPHGDHGGPYRRYDADSPGWDRWSWATRPGFHPLKAVTVLGGFAIAPPLGVLALAYFLWNSRHSFGQHYGPGPEQFAGGPGMGRGMGHGWGPGMGRGRCGGRGMRGRFTGNQAFDQHMMDTIEKLREERRAFFEYRAAERKKRDQEAYDAFRSAQSGSSEGQDGGSTKV